jgi:transcriptional regulator with XRE-family HTH domain
MPKDGLEELRAVLREAVSASRLSYREIEDQLGLGHGSLQRLLDGRVDVRVHHLVGLARILQVHPMEFLELGFPDWPSRHRLTDWMRPDSRIRRTRQALPSTREDLAALVREIVQEELGARENSPQSRSGLRAVATPEKGRKKP